MSENNQARQSLIIRPNQLAVELSCSMAHVWRLLKSGKIKKIQISTRCVGILRSDLDAFIEANRVDGSL